MFEIKYIVMNKLIAAVMTGLSVFSAYADGNHYIQGEISAGEQEVQPMGTELSDGSHVMDPVEYWTVRNAGEFKNCFSTEYYKLVLSGKINADDVRALWRMSLDGILTEIDLSDTEIEDGIFPANAFWHEDEQHSGICGHPHNIRLRSIALPSNTKEIGAEAFAHAITLEEIVLPEGLETIGDKAFHNTGLKEIELPNSFNDFKGTAQFKDCYSLCRISFPDGVKDIPDYFANKCLNLKEINIPSSVRTIGEHAFSECRSLPVLYLPEGVESIGDYALWCCDAINVVVFPSTLKNIGERACEFWAVNPERKIYSKAAVPPTCKMSNNDKTYGPFGNSLSNFQGNTWIATDIYVPKGTAGAYRSATGWNYFVNYIETDDFPDASVDEIVKDDSADESAYYDLNGREVPHPQPGHLYVRKGKKVILSPAR